MRKLKLQMQVSLDGYVAGPNGEQDWIFLPSKADPNALQVTYDEAASCDTLLIGRTSVNGFCGHWENIADNQPDSPWNAFAHLMVNHRKIAFSRTGETVSARNLEMANGDLETVVRALKSEPGKDILAYGGVDLARSLVELNLVDEYYLVVNPVAIGAGQSIFAGRKVLELQSSHPFVSGKILNKYVPV